MQTVIRDGYMVRSYGNGLAIKTLIISRRKNGQKNIAKKIAQRTG